MIKTVHCNCPLRYAVLRRSITSKILMIDVQISRPSSLLIMILQELIPSFTSVLSWIERVAWKLSCTVSIHKNGRKILMLDGLLR